MFDPTSYIARPVCVHGAEGPRRRLTPAGVVVLGRIFQTADFCAGFAHFAPSAAPPRRALSSHGWPRVPERNPQGWPRTLGAPALELSVALWRNLRLVNRRGGPGFRRNDLPRYALGVALRAVILAIVIADILPAQAPLCFGFNDVAPVAFPPVISVSNGLTVHFTAPVSSSISQIDIWSAIFSSAIFLFYIFPTPALGVPPTGFPIGSYAVTAPFGGSGWLPAAASIPATLASGSTYALQIIPYGGIQCTTVFYDPLGPQQLPYQNATSFGCTSSLPSSGLLGLIVRFRGTCPLASSTSLGASCGGPPGGQASFASNSPPILGSTWFGTVTGPAGGVAHLFWSGGVNPLGVLITPSSTCLYYLDDASLQSLAVLGAEPLLSGLVGASGQLTWAIPVPLHPIYAGLVIGAQVIVLDPSGTIPLGGGQFAQVTNALQLTLGF